MTWKQEEEVAHLGIFQKRTVGEGNLREHVMILDDEFERGRDDGTLSNVGKSQMPLHSGLPDPASHKHRQVIITRKSSNGSQSDDDSSVDNSTFGNTVKPAKHPCWYEIFFHLFGVKFLLPIYTCKILTPKKRRTGLCGKNSCSCRQTWTSCLVLIQFLQLRLSHSCWFRNSRSSRRPTRLGGVEGLELRKGFVRGNGRCCLGASPCSFGQIPLGSKGGHATAEFGCIIILLGEDFLHQWKW